jgi:hypothetical protein
VTGWCVLRSEGDDNMALHVVEDGLKKEAAMKEAKRLRKLSLAPNDSWADHYYAAKLEV